MLDERPLNRVQPVLACQSFDRRDWPAVVLDGECQAREDALAVGQDRSSAACSLVAPLLGAGQVEVLAQQVEKRHARIGRKIGRGPVDENRHSYLSECFEAGISDSVVASGRFT
jgi:hypothetical protein